VTAEAIIERLKVLPTVKPAPASAPLTAIAFIAGIEVATTSLTAESALRKAWRDRKGGGATPLLLLADDPSRAGSVLALGVVDANGPLRSIEAAALTEVIARISSKPRLEATRELAAELERLDQAGVPGLKLRDLLTVHTLDVRMRNDALRWQQAAEAVKDIDRGADWRTVLTRLGYELERLKHRGHLARFEGRPIAVVHPKADPAEFSRLDQDSRPPEGVLINDCLSEGAPFGMLTSGNRLRLFEADPGTGAAVAQYIDLDAGALQVDDRPFLGLLSPAFLAEGGFAKLRSEARQFGTGLRKRLDETIRQSVLPALGRALGRWAKEQGRDLSDDGVREDLEQAALTFVFRALFLLYAESGSHLPMDNRSYKKASLTSLVEEAVESIDRLSPRSTSLWDRFALLVKAMRNGNPAWAVPAYNGALFALDGFVGAATLELVEFADPDFAQMLIGVGIDPQTGGGVDYSTLEIGHLGHIYEGLLSLRLLVATQALKYDVRRDVYLPAEGEEASDVEAGDLLWQTHEGGRKSGGVYYTRSELVRHLVRQTVVPAYSKHLDAIKDVAEKNPAAAAASLFDFSVLDPACGSAHFLVTVVNELADMVTKFLADVPLPQISAVLERLRTGASAGVSIDDVWLIRRLVLKRCVFGVDVSPMGAEVAKISLWLASFVPGLTLAYLDRNVVVGDSLIGVARPESLRPPGSKDQAWFLEDELSKSIAEAAAAVAQVAESDDRTPDEIDASKAADAKAHDATAYLERLFNLWTAEPLGLKAARLEVEIHGLAVLQGKTNGLTSQAEALANKHSFLHWPLAFPAAFARARPGFDAVVGNPPWDEVMVEELGFYALFAPGIRGLPQRERLRAIEELLANRPDLVDRYSIAIEEAQKHRIYYSTSGEYPSMPGDPDLYKFFCQRYGALLRDNGSLGVVLPRSAFATLGSEGFRKWLFEQNTCKRVDFLLNTGRWAFDSEPRYTVALVAAERATPPANHRVGVAGTATSLEQWESQASLDALALAKDAFGPGWTTPLLRNQAEADLLAKIRRGSVFPLGSRGRWRCFPVRELDETNDKKLWERATEGWGLWKGESFEQYDPHGAESRWCPPSPAVMKKVTKPKPGSGSLLAGQVLLADRRKAVVEEVGRARVAFRDITNRTNSRTVLSCLVPPEVFLTNKAPYLAFVDGGNHGRAACLGVMNSLPFDWQARRFVEINLNFFILEGLMVPDLNDADFNAIAEAAARLSCVDERFAAFAGSFDIEPGPLDEDERKRLRVDIDARVARAWGLTEPDLNLLLSDFTLDAVPQDYRNLLAKRLKALS
jgi:hypothetical protein